MSSRAVLTAQSRVLMETLADAGVRNVVISPGSRSTPLVVAALACERLTSEWLLDERCAAFYALGRAKVSGRPSALVCTSGSAAANYYPAIVEASLSGTPLLVLTADRPFELQQCGASQTIDQVKMYGPFVRYFADLPMSEDSADAFRGLRRIVAQAVSATSQSPRGPVHLNCRARKPLEPPPSLDEADRRALGLAQRALDQPITRVEPPSREAPEAVIGALADRLRESKAGLVLVGPRAAADAGPELPAALAALAARTEVGIYAETTSQARLAWPTDAPDVGVVDALGTLLAVPSFADHFAPDFILQVGSAPIAASIDAFVRARPDIPRFIVAREGWPDPQSTAECLVVADPARSMTAVAEAVARRSMSGKASPWQAYLAAHNEGAWRAVDAVIAESPNGEAAAVRAALDSLDHGGLLALGNSLPVREVDTYFRARARGVVVHHQRGASGIDGALAGIAGAAREAARRTTALIGDLTFLHDLGGLSALATADVSVAVVVLNNGGGRIFEQLPIAAAGLSARELDHWTTPHQKELRRLAEPFGIASTSVRSIPELSEALSGARQREQATIIEVPIEPHAARDERARLVRAVNGALRDIGAQARS